MSRQGLLAAVLASTNRTIRLDHNHLHRAALGMLMTVDILCHFHILALLGERNSIANNLGQCSQNLLAKPSTVRLSCSSPALKSSQVGANDDITQSSHLRQG
jgi:hypothetical protein